MSGPAAPVAVVIVSWNSAGYLPGCLESLRALERRPAELVVVDNESRDDSVELVRRGYPEAEIVEQQGNSGFCRANNVGIRQTRSPLVLLLNPDTRLEARFVEELLPCFEDPRVGIACGKLLRFDGRTLDSAGQQLGRSRRPLDRGYGRTDRGQFDRDEEVFGACAAAALYRRSTLESIADGDGEFFDERFFAFCEDLDLAWRARRLGWKTVYRHRAVGYHARGGSAERPGRRGPAMLRRSPGIRFHIVKNRWLTMARNDTLRSVMLDLPFILARDLATLALLAATSPSVIARLWRSRPLLAESRERGRLDEQRPRHHVPVGEDRATG